MTNAEALVEALKEVNDDDVAESLISYIDCPSSPGCTYDGGKDHSPCTDCKIKWLRSEWED